MNASRFMSYLSPLLPWGVLVVCLLATGYGYSDEMYAGAHGNALYLALTAVALTVAVSAFIWGYQARRLNNQFRRAEQSLKESEQLNRAILNTTVDGLLVVDLQGHFLDVNPAFCRLLGYTREELLGLSLRDIEANETPEQTALHIERIMAAGSGLFETRHRRKDGTLVEVEVSANYLAGNDRFFSFIRDITERKKSEQERLLQTEQQRDTVVREVHHRIKNNLQGVIGLLDIYVGQHPEAVEPISNVTGKIKSVAVVFGLQGRRAENDIRLCEVTAEVCKSAEELTHSTVEPHVEVDLARPIQVAKDKAVPIALIVNELVTNALKHSHSEDHQEPIRVRISTDGKSAILTIRNKCLMLPQGFDFDLGEGMGTGLTLVRSMLPREGAKLSLTLDGGIMTAELRLTSPVVTIPGVPSVGAVPRRDSSRKKRAEGGAPAMLTASFQV